MKKSNLKILALVAVIVVVIIAFILLLIRWQNLPGKYDDFAKCLKTEGAVFYGAFWCPHCQSQKALFGKSAKYLPYVECSLPSGQGITNECQAKEIKSYPTWLFPDGSVETGQKNLEYLADKVGCELPKTE